MKRKQRTKISLYTFCLGPSKEEVEIHEGDVLSPMYPSKIKASKAMEKFRRTTKWPTGSLIKITIEKVQ